MNPRSVRSTVVSEPRRMTIASASPDYEYWTRQDLYQHAQDVGISGRSTMTKSQLIAALRAR